MTEEEAIEYLQQRYERLEKKLKGKYVTAPVIPNRDKSRYESVDRGLSDEERANIFTEPMRDYHGGNEYGALTEGARQYLQRI